MMIRYMCLSMCATLASLAAGQSLPLSRITADLALEKTPAISPGFAQPSMYKLAADVYVARLSSRLWVHTTVGTLADGSLYTANGVLLENGETSILFDVGWTPEQARVLLKWAKDDLKHPVTKAYVTHFHNDRLGGTEELERERIPVFATTLTIQLARETKQPVPDRSIAVPIKPARVAKDAVLLFPGSGHTRDNIVVDFPEEGVLFGGCFLKAGDAGGIGNTADADLAAWPSSLIRMEAEFPNPQLQIPGHGPMGMNAARRTAELLREIKTRK